MEYRAALYIRLSKEDENQAMESESVANQKALLIQYAQSHSFSIVDCYVDDGWSGTHFNRPDFCRMIRDIECRGINLVITKDLSRLGREYILTGQYLEYFFPLHGVRFIAINDQYDSLLNSGEMIPFYNLIKVSFVSGKVA